MFDFFKKNDSSANISYKISLKDLAERLKILYYDVSIIDEDTINIGSLDLLLRHEKDSPIFEQFLYLQIPPNMILPDELILNYCNRINLSEIIKVSFHKYEDESSLVFSIVTINFSTMNLTDLNEFCIAGCGKIKNCIQSYKNLCDEFSTNKTTDEVSENGTP